MDMKDLHELTGAEIQRAAKELPEGYEIIIELEKGSGVVRLFVPPASENENGEVVTEFAGDVFADEIKNAIDYAIEHKTNAES